MYKLDIKEVKTVAGGEAQPYVDANVDSNGGINVNAGATFSDDSGNTGSVYGGVTVDVDGPSLSGGVEYTF